MVFQIIKLISLISYPFFFLVSFSLLKLANLDSKKCSFSFLGATKPYGKFFDLNLIMAGVFQLTIFSSIYIYHLIDPTPLNIISVVFLSLTTITGILAGVITINVSETFHIKIATVGFASSSLGWILFSLSLYKVNIYYGLLIMSLGLILIPYLTTVYKKVGDLKANYESLFFLAAYLTNLVIYMTYFA